MADKIGRSSPYIELQSNLRGRMRDIRTMSEEEYR